MSTAANRDHDAPQASETTACSQTAGAQSDTAGSSSGLNPVTRCPATRSTGQRASVALQSAAVPARATAVTAATPHPRPASSPSPPPSPSPKRRSRDWTRKGKGKAKETATQPDGTHGTAFGSNVLAIGTRSRKPDLYHSHEWEAQDIAKGRSSNTNTMSRNRPRGPPATRENGFAADEEVEMWNKIRQDIGKAKEKNDRQKAVGQQIAALNEKIAKNGSSRCTLLFLF